MEETTKSQHLRSMDVLKGIILMIIVFGHMIVNERGGGGGGTDSGMPVIVQALYLGLMAFFILSGYFYRPNRTFKENMLKRLKQIAIPFVIAGVFFPLFTYLVLLAAGNPYPNLPFDDYIVAMQRGLFVYNAFVPYDQATVVYAYSTVTYGAYFLVAMLWGFLIFYGLAKYVMDDIKKVIVTIIVLLAINVLIVQFCQFSIPFFFKMGPIAAAFMFVGASLAKIKFLENMEYGNKKSLKYWLVPIVCFIAGFAMCYILPPDIQFDNYIYGQYGTISMFPYFIEAVLMFVPIAYIGFIFSMIPGVSWVFDIMGKHTLGTILIHPVVAKVLVVMMGYAVSNRVLVPNGVSFEIRIFIAIMCIVIPVLICHFGPKIIEKLKDKKKATPQEA